MVITVILGLVIVGLLGFAFWQNFMQPKTETAKKDSSSVITPAVTTPVVTDPMADWKTYTNAQYGFSIKYPADWTVQEAPTENGNSFPSPLPDILAKSPSGDDMRIWINIVDGWGYTEEVFDIVRYTVTPSAQGIVLSDRFYRAGTPKESSLGYSIDIDFDYGGNKYMTLSTGDNPDELDAGEKVLTQIISTWKFN